MERSLCVYTPNLHFTEDVGEESGQMSYAHESEKYSTIRLSGEEQPAMATKTRRKRMKSRVKRQTYFDQGSYDRMLATFEKAYTIKGGNCKGRPSGDLLMGGDVAYGVDKQFERQARIALRLSHFVSNYLQNINPGEVFGHIREMDYCIRISSLEKLRPTSCQISGYFPAEYISTGTSS